MRLLRSSRASFALLATVVLAACTAAACAATGDPRATGGSGSSETTTGTPTGQTLAIAPADHVLALGEGKPAFIDYKVLLVEPDGAEKDVTDEAELFSGDLLLGTFVGTQFQSTGVPGKTTVKAKARGLTAETSLEVRKENIILAPGAPADAPTKFGGAEDPARAPGVVYPADGVMVPPNMNVLEFHFTPGAGNDLFELSFSSSTVDIKVYLPCSPLGAGCAYTPDAEVWKLVAEAGRGADPITYKLRGTSAGAAGTVGSAAPQTISFAEEDIVGGVYYWNAGAGATVRYEFGVSGQTAEMYMNAATAGAMQCVGCHVLSRDGSRIAVGLDIPAPSVFKVYDVAKKSQYFQQGSLFGGGGANFFSFSPENAQIATSNGLWIDLKNADTGATITEKLVPVGAMPDFSPDGKRLVYARPAQPPPCVGGFCGATGVSQASLEYLTFVGGAWSAPTPLVPFAGQNNYYPSFSPDGGWVIFNRSNLQDSYDAQDAELWVVQAAPNSTPIKLAKASTGGDSWPKWAPDVQMYKSGSLMWLTFSSRRAYGLRLGAGQQAQIWMTAFDPAKAKLGEDPSYPGFWLPFQDIGSGNHIAQWVTKVDRKPCTMDGECEGSEKCVEGLCKPILK
ncbi:PD40 domain-containing protein [Polyangium aurulentum]|uniref:PD40 domain-containing protein n=1 Tax=Polyangium aurulentum TaxID=2567896 RepID=UPI0010AE514A|nr:PD40 domain-containing protein [Polyangium aurulentum]UQA55577.1 PD40 domain-containing protein [Polyangium aurulentum]